MCILDLQFNRMTQHPVLPRSQGKLDPSNLISADRRHATAQWLYHAQFHWLIWGNVHTADDIGTLKGWERWLAGSQRGDRE